MSDTPSDRQEKKIIVDEDWKAQVEAERESLKRREDQEESAEPRHPPRGPLPPPNLELLVSSFAMQAMIALGVIANSAESRPEVRLDEAKHFIDTIEMLQAKTAGNRTPEESEMMENALHELRLAYVTVRDRAETPSS